MEKLINLLQELKDVNTDKKAKCMVRGDSQGLIYCHGFDSCIDIISYHLYKQKMEEEN